MKPTKKQKLFIVSGASGVGKSTACEILFQKEEKYIVLESDLLWSDLYNTPEDNYCAYRKLWMTVVANVAQIGLPVVLCGCAVPEQFEGQEERELFEDIHYLAVVCDKEKLEEKMRVGRKIEDESWIQSSVDFNEWLKKNGQSTQPAITLVDNTKLTPEQTAQEIHEWVMKHL